MNGFKAYHPVVNLVYFVFVIGFSMFFMHPVSLAVSLFCGLTYSAILNGSKTIKRNLVYTLPVLLLMAVINPIFNHEGETILAYLPWGNPLTLEAIVYGLSAAFMIVSVIYWFSCYNEIMTDDKFVYLFGRILPSASLIISMTLRFVPRFAAQLKSITAARKCMGHNVSGGSIINRIKQGMSILSVATTWALENSIDTSDSMKSRGYGIPGRTAFSIYSFSKRDVKAVAVILALSIYVLLGGLKGGMNVVFFPCIEYAEFSYFRASVFGAYLLLCMYPVIISIKEAIKWKFSK